MSISRETVGTILRRAGVTKTREAYREEMAAQREVRARQKEPCARHQPHEDLPQAAAG